MLRLAMPLCILGILAVSAGPALAQELEAPDPFWLSRERQRSAAVAELVLAQNPVTTSLLFLHARRSLVWKEPELPTDRAPALTQNWLDEIADKTDMPRLNSKTKIDDPAGWAFFLAAKEATIY